MICPRREPFNSITLCAFGADTISKRLPNAFRFPSSVPKVEALARRLRCRLVKVSPGRLAAAAGVEADR